MNKSHDSSGQKVEQELMLIGGEWTGSVDGRFLPVENPGRRDSVVAEVPRGKAEDVDLAVKAAAKAFEDWRKVTPWERGKLMARIADDVEAHVVCVVECLRINGRATFKRFHWRDRNEPAPVIPDGQGLMDQRGIAARLQLSKMEGHRRQHALDKVSNRRLEDYIAG